MICKACRLAALVATAAISTAARADPQDTVAVYAPVRPVTDVYHGVSVTDPYRWLEDPSDPLVKNWTEAENLRARSQIDGFRSRTPVKQALTRLISAASPSYAGLQAKGASVFALYNDPARQQPQLVALDANADPASRRVMLDPNALDPAGLTAIDWFVASPDGRHVAVSLSKNGSEDGVLHVYDAASGQEVGQPIPKVQYPTAGGALAWSADGRGFWYTRYPGEDAPASEQHFNLQVFFHTLGGDWRADPLVLGTKDGLERVSEVFLSNRYARRSILASVQRGDGGAWAHYLLQPGKPPIQLSTYGDQIVYAVIGPDDAVYGVSRAGAPKGKIVKLRKPRAGASLASAPVIVPESDVAILTDGAEQQRPDLTLDKRHLIVRDIVGGPTQIRVFDLDGALQFKLPMPEVAANGEIEPLADGDILFDVSTYLRPRYYLRWTPASGGVAETGLGAASPIDFSDAEVVRAFARSRDGTQVPVNIIRRRGYPLTGQTPTVLYGYGGYGVSQTPHFLGAMWRLWLDAGGAYAIANIRGGSEFGETWHSQGALTNKQNVFDDFTAAAQWLIDGRYTSHERLAILGGSNGGLLVGAVLTEHPDLARAVVSAVGIYDMLRVERDPNGAFNVTEFGTVKDEAQFRALYAYSPYHHVKIGTAYPAVLMLTGANDGRVNPMQSRKFTAALQAATSSDQPILLRTSTTSGHGIGSSLAERIDEQSDELSFLFDRLNVAYPPSSAQPHPPPVPLPPLHPRRHRHRGH